MWHSSSSLWCYSFCAFFHSFVLRKGQHNIFVFHVHRLRSGSLITFGVKGRSTGSGRGQGTLCLPQFLQHFPAFVYNRYENSLLGHSLKKSSHEWRCSRPKAHCVLKEMRKYLKRHYWKEHVWLQPTLGYKPKSHSLNESVASGLTTAPLLIGTIIELGAEIWQGI